MINSKDFFLALDQLEKEKKIDKEFFISALESALTSAYKKNFGEARSATVKLNPEKGTIKVYAYKTIVEEVEDPDKEVSLEDAKQIKSTYKIGDTISEEVTPKSFGRIAAQTAKQVVMQRLREAERENLSNELNTTGDQLTTAVVRRKDATNVYVELSGTDAEGVLGEKDIIPGEKLEIGDRIKVIIKRVRDNGYGAEVQVSRTTTSFVRKLFEIEVPELASGEVEIKSIAREAGNRTKLSVYSPDPNVDPVGACVGARGARINAVIEEINGEKIDVIRYSEDDFVYIANALSPAEVISVEINQESKTSRVIVPDNKLSLAIGKEGCNVRLAARLTGWKIDVKSESTNAKEEQSRQVQEFTPSFDASMDDDIDIFEDIQAIE
ncbi:MAG: transcription termination/antitermination protein NusA [Clostridia bacterium]|nr:transcription termination/antitermination protein NusA [Clostridia bacterium]